MTDAPERIWAFYAPHISEDEDGATIVAYETRQYGAAEYIRVDIHEAEIERLRAVLQSMDDTIVARSELFISDQECLFNLRDRIRRATLEGEK